MKKTGEKKKKIKKAAIAIALACVLGGSAAALFASRSLGAFEEANALTYGEYKTRNQVEDCTLFIGTWLIHKDSLTDDYYNKAVKSGADSGQEIKLYKSELGDGMWFDISKAESLNDISDGAPAVPENEVDPLYVEFVIDKAGRMHSAKGDELNPYNTPDPYDLKNLQELQSIWLQFAQDSSTEKNVTEQSYLEDHNSEAKQRVESDKYIYGKVAAFWGSDVRDEETARLDAAVDALYQFSLDLKNNDRQDDALTVSDLIEKVDHRRRAIVFSKLEEVEESYLEVLYQGASGAFLQPAPPDSGDNRVIMNRPQDTIDGPFYPDEPMLDAINAAMDACKNSFNNHSNAQLMDSDTILGHLEYQYSQAVIDNAGTAAADEPLRRLAYVVAIRDSKIVNKEGELLEINQNMMPPGENNYRAAVLGGQSPEYTAAVDSGASSAQSSSLLDQQDQHAEITRSEFQFFITAKTDRMTNADALAFVNERITWTEALLPLVPDDDFHAKATNSINAHLKWLRDLLEKIKNRDSALNSDLDNLVEEKNELIKDKQSALDDNDLSGAARIDKLLGVVDDKINDEIARLTGGDGTGAGAGPGAGGAVGAANELLSDALGTIGDEGPDSDGIKNIMGALGGLGATDQLNKLKDALADSGANAGTMNAADAALKDAQNSNLISSVLSGSGYNLNGMSDEDLLKLLMSLLGKDAWNDLTGDEKALICAALSELGDKGHLNCRDLAELLAARLYGRPENNPYVFQKYKGSGANGNDFHWISLKTVGDVTEYRYVYDDSRNEAILSGIYGSYSIYVGQYEANRGTKVIKLYAKPVLQSRIPYAAERDTEKLFDVTCDYIGNSDYGVALTGQMRTKVNELMNTLTGQ